MAKVITTTFKIRRGDSSVWMSNNPTLADGELGFELDTGRLKIGRDALEWNALPYIDDKLIEEILNIKSNAEVLGETIAAENANIRKEIADADSLITTDLAEEIARAKAAEAQNSTNLNTKATELSSVIDTERTRAMEAEAQTLADAKAYTDEVKANLLGEGVLNETYDTLKEISDWIVSEGVDAAELTSAIAEEAKSRSEKDTEIEDNIKKEVQERKDAMVTLKTELEDYVLQELGVIENGYY
jgi:hypothetical protein